MRVLFLLIALFWTSVSAAQTLSDREGWTVIATNKPHEQLIADVIAATKANKMGVVTQAGPTKMAASRGITIPGNRVIGIFNNDFAVKILALSTAAMIEAPIRMYVTEGEDGLATLAYKRPSFVFRPYMDEGGDELSALAGELDARFDAIADMAVN